MLWSNRNIRAYPEHNVGCLGETHRGGVVKLRPADVFLPNWSAGRGACLDVTGVSIIAHSHLAAGGAATHAATQKIVKHADSCSRAGFDFIPFAFDTAGHLATDAVAVLRRLQMAWASSQVVRDDVANNFVLRKIGFTVMKGIAKQLVGRLRDGDPM